MRTDLREAAKRAANQAARRVMSAPYKEYTIFCVVELGKHAVFHFVLVKIVFVVLGVGH